MNARTAFAQFDRPAPLCYHEGEVNRCPQCTSRAWHVGRTTAECAQCGHPLPLAQATHAS